MRPWLIIINDFCHDLFTGIWFGSFFTLALFRYYHGTESGSVLQFIAHVEGLFFWICILSLILIALTGAYRSTYYRDWDSAGMKQVKDRLLVIKHAILGTLFLVGTILSLIWHW